MTPLERRFDEKGLFVLLVCTGKRAGGDAGSRTRVQNCSILTLHMLFYDWRQIEVFNKNFYTNLGLVALLFMTRNPI